MEDLQLDQVLADERPRLLAMQGHGSLIFPGINFDYETYLSNHVALYGQLLPPQQGTDFWTAHQTSVIDSLQKLQGQHQFSRSKYIESSPQAQTIKATTGVPKRKHDSNNNNFSCKKSKLVLISGGSSNVSTRVSTNSDKAETSTVSNASRSDAQLPLANDTAKLGEQKKYKKRVKLPGLTPLEEENLKREQKNEREKQRRASVNDQYERLSELLNLPKNNGIDKVTILKLAVETLQALKHTVMLQASDRSYPSIDKANGKTNGLLPYGCECEKAGYKLAASDALIIDDNVCRRYDTGLKVGELPKHTK